MFLIGTLTKDVSADRQCNMQYLTPVFATLKPEVDDVIKLNAMVEDYATALNRKDILHVRLKAVTGDDTAKVLFYTRLYNYRILWILTHLPSGSLQWGPLEGFQKPPRSQLAE